ncbi:LysR substrate-binding domain-containing protein [Roseibium salinum]|uniref:LysR substrate-binding domain-containing protein n=1 Tax=Roseibium salinum TaxID=1604349 RepID=A0ABT3QX17_9HYPH|nr:LysR substrate-binding domain-containing protein [Roseibium sp. DSM 29163]MCX2721479.1 LysR substrate-binding domain-containing protein [Roseibium sp. DSM 29163]MDN3721959.1 LysR substrate-binding domain-containing protein [Roseibium salinum]
MELDHVLLKTFVACIDAMSFTRAASLVHRSPAAVSMQIARLEEQIGARLFVRDTRNLALTRTGEELEGYARRILRLHDEAVEAFRRPDMAGSVTIGAPDDYISFVLPPVLRHFGALFPRVEIELVCAQSTALVPRVEKGEIDLAIVTRSAGMEGELIRREPMVWIASRDRVALERTPLPVALFEPGSQARAVVLAALGRGNVRYRSAYASFSYSALLTIVEAGLAVAAVTQISAPSSVACLTEEDGLPAVEPLDVILIRRPGSASIASNALAEAILDRSA